MSALSLPWLSLYWPSLIEAIMLTASLGILLLAAGHDIASRTVPNWMSGAIACFGIVTAFADDRLPLSLGIGLGVFILGALAWRRGFIGGADVKLLGGIGIVLPPGMVSMFFVAMSLSGAVHALSYMLARRVVTPPPPQAAASRGRPLLARALRAERWRISRGGPLPYACAIAFGFLFVICNGVAP